MTTAGKFALTHLAQVTANLALTGAVVLAMTGCGGGGGTAAGTATPPAADAPVVTIPVVTPAAVTISGVAASGAAFSGAVITVTDSTGATVGSFGPVPEDGTFSITLAEGAKAPFVIVAARTNASGVVDSLVSVMEGSTSGTVNVTPVTTLVASRLSPSGDPLKLADEVKAGTATIDASSVTAKVSEIKAILQPVLAATGTSDFDPIKGSFAANGTGFDRVLDSINVTITPSSTTTTNIEVGIRQASTDPQAQPPVIQFNNSQTLANITENAANGAVINAPIAASTLVESGTNALIASFMTRLTACYALPLSSRVSTGGTAAPDIVAPECKTLFVDNNPATYKSGGSVVAKGQSFNGIFVEGGTGVVFSQGSYEFTRTNGDLVIGYRSVTAAGAEAFDSLVVRKVGDELKLIGNQYRFQGAVNAKHQYRQYPTLGQSAFNNYSTGYVLSINNQLANGVSIFDRVEVTTPKGTVLVLKPTSGSPVLFLVKTGTTPVTNFLRLRSEFADASLSGTPSDKEPSLFYANPMRTEAEMAEIPAQSVWKFDYFLKTDTVNAAATQYYKTRARALTVGEFKAKTLATLTDAALTGLQTSANAAGRIALGGAPITGVAWTVGAGALPVARIDVDGGLYDPATGVYQMQFSDGESVASTARTGAVNCSVNSIADLHCDAGGLNYAAGAEMTTLQLWAKDSSGREFANAYATYRLSWS
jgi:hypothetical protein